MVLRGGVIGYGNMGKNHVRVLQQMSGIHLVGIVEPDTEIREIERTPLVASLEELAALKPDFVIIATPPATHEELAIAAIDRNLHLLIEKPLALTSSSANRIRIRAEEAGVICAVGHVERFNPASIELKQRLHQIGKIHQIVLQRKGPQGNGKHAVGVVHDLACHDIDLVHWLTGSSFSHIFAEAVQTLPGSFEDSISAIGRLENATIVTIQADRISPRKERSCVATGEKGVLIADLLASDVYFESSNSEEVTWQSLANFQGPSRGAVSQYSFQKSEPLQNQLEAFRNSILGLSAGAAPVIDGVKTLDVIDAILESVAECRRVDVKSIS